MKRLLPIVLSLMLLGSCHAQPAVRQVLRTGAEELLDCKGHRWGHEDVCAFAQPVYMGRLAVVANQTSLVGNTHLVDTLLASDVVVTKIFCPEHGFRGTAEAGAHVDNSIDSKTGIPIVSLYGKNKKPTQEHDGPVLDTAHYRSFVGMHPVPVVYGMTIGEYARMINGEGWLSGGEKCDLTVVPMKGYKRDSVGYELPVPPSPNLRNAHAIALYPSLCLFEGTHCGVGRGTGYPFERVSYGSDTLDLRGEEAPSAFSLRYLMEMYRRVPKGKFFQKSNFFEKLAGNGDLRKQISSGMSEEEIRATWQPALDEFKKIREKYLIYK